MSIHSLSLMVVSIPALVLGTSSCSSVGQTQQRMAEWKEKREERRMAREVALAEKEIAEEASETGRVATNGMEESIFLDYANPGGSLIGGVVAEGGSSGGYGGGPALPGTELPVVLDLAATEGVTTDGGDVPVFHADGPVPVDADLVRAWASTISPLMGASLTEPLITAAMTAQVTPTETAVAAHAAATDTAPLASAFAGQPARPGLASPTSELEHE